MKLGEMTLGDLMDVMDSKDNFELNILDPNDRSYIQFVIESWQVALGYSHLEVVKVVSDCDKVFGDTFLDIYVIGEEDEDEI